MPVVDFYMKGVTNEERGRVSFVCTCTLKEDMDRVSKELNLNLDTDTWIIEGISARTTPLVPHLFGVEIFNSSSPGGICGGTANVGCSVSNSTCQVQSRESRVKVVAISIGPTSPTFESAWSRDRSGGRSGGRSAGSFVRCSVLTPPTFALLLFPLSKAYFNWKETHSNSGKFGCKPLQTAKAPAMQTGGIFAAPTLQCCFGIGTWKLERVGASLMVHHS